MEIFPQKYEKAEGEKAEIARRPWQEQAKKDLANLDIPEAFLGIEELLVASAHIPETEGVPVIENYKNELREYNLSELQELRRQMIEKSKLKVPITNIIDQIIAEKEGGTTELKQAA